MSKYEFVYKIIVEADEYLSYFEKNKTDDPSRLLELYREAFNIRTGILNAGRMIGLGSEASELRKYLNGEREKIQNAIQEIEIAADKNNIKLH